MKRCHNVDGTPNNRPSSPTTFRTPVNARPSTVWSPIFHAITPDLNAVTPVDGGKTPALLKSLGIQQELDVSWTNAMATPNTSSDMSSHAAVAGIFALQTPESKEEKSSKVCFYFLCRGYHFLIFPNSQVDFTEAALVP